MKKQTLLFLTALALLSSSVQASLITQPMDYLRTNLITTGSQSLTNEWQIGFINKTSGTFSLLNSIQIRPNSNDTQYRWFDGATPWYGAYFFSNLTTIGTNNWMNPGAGGGLAADSLGFHPTNDNNLDIVLRYLASSTGELSASGSFTSTNPGTKNAFIKDTSFGNIDNANIGGSQTWDFDETISLNANESVYFGINPFNGWVSDATGLKFDSVSFSSAQASPSQSVPEPSSLIMFASMLALFGFKRLRKS